MASLLMLKFEVFATVNLFFISVLPLTKSHCPVVPASYKGPVKFTTDENEVDYVRYGHYVELRCCGAGYNVINWLKWNNSTFNWDSYHPGPGQLAPAFSEDRQILVIKSATESDAGTYKCQLYRNVKEQKERKINLHVNPCDHLARGPIPMAPEPRDQYVSKLGEPVTFPCLGYFGCADEGDFRVVGWFVQDKNTEKWTDISSGGNKRYVETHFTREDVIVGTNLTITDVQRYDIDTTFMCVMSSPQVVHGETRLSVKVHLKAEDRIDTAGPSIVTVIVVPVAVSVVFLVVIVIIVVQNCKRKKENDAKMHPKETTEINEYTACV